MQGGKLAANVEQAEIMRRMDCAESSWCFAQLDAITQVVPSLREGTLADCDR